jgi:hypothetical protein
MPVCVGDSLWERERERERKRERERARSKCCSPLSLNFLEESVLKSVEGLVE